MQSLLIVGAGVFGLSTALAASAASEEHQVTLIDDGYVNSASRGLGRIYRSQYPREEYERLALEAKELWKKGIFSKNFHKTTKIIVHPDGSEERDDGAAWIDANVTMREALKEAEKRGVRIIEGRVSRLVWDGSRCIGATTRDGRSFFASTVLLALGAALPSFLADEKRPIDGICEPIVVPWMCAQLTSEQYEQLKTKPIVVHPGAGEYLPPNNDMKIWVNNPRTARVGDVFALRDTLSQESPYFTETYDLFVRMLPELGDAPAESFSFFYCVDCITPSQDFLIGPVPDSDGLFIAAGGSCHAFKFFPVLGDYILPILSGKVTEYSRLWSCEGHRQLKQELNAKSDATLLVHGEVIPRRTFLEE
ncbi:hypothetical protein VTK56DRAFT_6105 [Thermocarpiscus australiensis]